MDRMTEYELSDILECLQFTDVNSWEQTRLQIYVLGSMFSKNKMKAQDILTFPWEKIESKLPEALPTEISNDDISRLKARASYYEKNMSQLDG